MPELPEVETVRAGLEATVAGKAISHVHLARKDLRAPFPPGFAKALEGRGILRVARRGKYLLFHLEGGLVWLAHLGMSGHFRVLPAPPERPGAHDHVRILFADGSALIFNDARRFGIMDLAREKELAAHKLLAALGPEPLEKGFSAAYLKQALAVRRGPVKPVLMDAGLVVGVGNIYASEALFAARLDPRVPACQAASLAKELVAAIRLVLKDAIASGGSSLRDFISVGGEAGYFQHRFQVYGRDGKPCYACGSSIQTLRQAGRSTFFCPRCQRRPQKA